MLSSVQVKKISRATNTGLSRMQMELWLMDLCLSYAKQYYKKCYLETFGNMIAANKFYQKNGFVRLEKPYLETEHFSCDVWYIKDLNEV